MNKEIKEIQYIYNSRITKDFIDMIELMYKYGDIISREISYLIKDSSEESEIIKNYYDLLIETHINYNNKYISLNNNELNKYLILFFNSKIISVLKNINTAFNEQVQIMQIQLNNNLKNYTFDNVIDKTLINITNSQIINKIFYTQNNLKKIFKEFRYEIIKKFEDLPQLLKNKTKDIYFEGFNDSRYNLRKLENYNISEIETIIEYIEENYNDFKNNILTNENFYDIITKKISFNTTLYNSISILTNDFYAYKVLIEQYTDDRIIEEYFIKLETDAFEIRKIIEKFNLNFSKRIDDTLNIIYYEIKDSWNIIRNEANQYISQSLDEVYEEKFSSLKDISFNKTLNNNYNLSKIIEFIDRNNEIVSSITIDVNNINISYGNSLKRLGT